jgi:DNA-directed RNA polymerase specialized sigma24 family protein
VSDDAGSLAELLEGHRGHLRAVAYRMLGSLPEADDAVQESAHVPDPILTSSPT